MRVVIFLMVALILICFKVFGDQATTVSPTAAKKDKTFKLPDNYSKGKRQLRFMECF